jgi:PIN domain
MSKSPPTHFFLDTNSLLHFKRPDQIDWTELSKTAAVLVIAPVLLDELEEQKIHNRSSILRERATAIIKWLGDLLENPSSRTIRPSVTVEFLPYGPTIDFVQYRLRPNVTDDELIASVIHFTLETPGASVSVVTDDLGLRTKLQMREISILRLPDQYKLPVTSDPNEKQIKELRKELDALRSRIPKLALTFDNGDRKLSVTLKLSPPTPTISTVEEVKEAYPLIPILRGSPRTMEEHQLHQELQVRGWMPESVDRFNTHVLAPFYSRWTHYSDSIVEWLEERQRLFEVTLLLSNGGTAVATNLDIFVQFPDDIELYENMPQPPDPPNVPHDHPARKSSVGLSTVPRLRQVVGHGAGFPDISGRRVCFHVTGLKHHHDRQLGKFFVGFKDEGSIRSFAADHIITSAEVPEAVEGKLHFVVNAERQ